MFSIIIINYNTARLTLDCLDSIYSCCNATDLEIIVVDNGSTVSDRNILESGLKQRARLIKSEKNLGFAAGNNLGARQARGRYLCFLNSDVILDENIFDHLSQVFLEDKQVGIVAPRLINADGSAQAKAYGPFPSLGYLFYKNLFGHHDNDFPKKIDWVSGAALCIRKDVFALIGGWDENFFLYLEDVDLCWSAHNQGYQILIDQATQVTHLQGQSLAQSLTKQAYYYDSQKYLFKKHYGRLALFILLLGRWPHRLLFLLRNKRHENRS